MMQQRTFIWPLTTRWATSSAILTMKARQFGIGSASHWKRSSGFSRNGGVRRRRQTNHTLHLGTKSSMAIKTISLSRLETDLKKTLNECAESGETLVVELPDQRLLAIQSLDPLEDDTLMEELLATNPKFQELVAKSKRSPRKPFTTR